MKTTRILDTHETLSLKGNQEVYIKKGVLWVTYEGDSEDYFFKSGERMQIKSKHPALIEAMERSDLEIYEKNKVVSSIFNFSLINFLSLKMKRPS